MNTLSLKRSALAFDLGVDQLSVILAVSHTVTTAFHFTSQFTNTPVSYFQVTINRACSQMPTQPTNTQTLLTALSYLQQLAYA